MAATDLISILQQTGGISAIASQLGIPPAMAEAGAGALLPAIVGGFSKQAESGDGMAAAEPAGGGMGGGLGGLIGMLGGLGGTGLADNVLSPEPTNIDAGNTVLGQIFGSKDVSRTVADHAAGQSGLDPALLKKMLPILAMLVTGYLSQAGGAQQGQPGGGAMGGGGMGGILGSVLGSVLGGGAQAAPAGGGGLGGGMGGGLGGGLGGMLGSLLGAGRTSGGGNALDAIIGMAGKMGR